MAHDDQGRLDVILEEAIKFVNMTVNVRERLNSFQVADAVITLQKEFGFLKVEEIIKALNNGRTGRYNNEKNPLYRLDLTILCGWIDKYLERDRDEGLQELKRQEKAEGVKNLIPLEVVEDYSQKFDKMIRSILDKKKDKIYENTIDEKKWKESFQNNLPYLTDDALQDWKKGLKKEKEFADLLELVENEIEYRKNKKL